MMASIEQRVSRMEASLSMADPYADWTDAELEAHIHLLRQSTLLSIVNECDLLAGPMREEDREVVTRLVQYLRRIDQLLKTADRSRELTDAELIDATRTCRDLMAKYRPDAVQLAEFDQLLMREADTWPQ